MSHESAAERPKFPPAPAGHPVCAGPDGTDWWHTLGAHAADCERCQEHYARTGIGHVRKTQWRPR